jgi:zona occludens toxin
MTIYLYSGTPGSGKSLHQARDIWYRGQNGKPVIVNFDVNTTSFKHPECIHTVYNDDLTPDYLERFSRAYFAEHSFREGAIKLYIDESQLLFNAREWNSRGRKDWLRFFTQHRKYGYDVILVAQYDRMLDRQIRALIEYEYIHRKITNVGVWGWVFFLASFGGRFLCVKQWYPQSERVGREFIRPFKRYTSIYNTYALFDSDDGAPASDNVVSIAS